MDELEKLKETWNILGDELKKKNKIDDKSIDDIIHNKKKNIGQDLSSLVSFQKKSLLSGGIGLFIIAVIAIVSPFIIEEIKLTTQIISICSFLAISCLVGMWWDLKTYRITKSISIWETPVIVVLKRIDTFMLWTKYEIIGISIWAITFSIFYFTIMRYYLLETNKQIILVSAFLIFDIIIIYLLYKKKIISPIKELRRNIKKLKQLYDEQKD